METSSKLVQSLTECTMQCEECGDTYEAGSDSDGSCPRCGTSDSAHVSESGLMTFKCNDCGTEWNTNVDHSTCTSCQSTNKQRVKTNA